MDKLGYGEIQDTDVQLLKICYKYVTTIRSSSDRLKVSLREFENEFLMLQNLGSNSFFCSRSYLTDDGVRV